MSIIVSCSRGHNASTTLLVNGEIIFYLEEERLSRWKRDGTPLLGLTKVFEYVDHIDHLVICHTHRNGPQNDWTGEDIYRGYIRKLSRKKFNFKVTCIDRIHHEMHATCAFVNSGFDSAGVLVADGAGSFLQTTVTDKTVFEFESIYHAKKPLDVSTKYKHLGTDGSVGYVTVDEDRDIFISENPGIVKEYEAVTGYCGWSTIDAGKTMGLSPYGKENPDLPPMFRNGLGNRDLFVPNYPNGAHIIEDRYPILVEDCNNHKNGEWTQVQKDLALSLIHI